MEAPVAAALGKLDAFNLFDPYWADPEWDVWYALLNCGFVLPPSTGSDWFVCSSNRVYVQTGSAAEPPAAHGAPERHAAGEGVLVHPLDPGAIRPAPHAGDDAPGAGGAHGEHAGAGGDHGRIERAFSYAAWLDGLRAGRTFITNGPALFLDVAGRGPGHRLEVTQRTDLAVTVRWRSALPINRVEVIHNGEVAAREAWGEGRCEGTLTARVSAAADDGNGWIAARCFGDARTSYGHFLWAHSGPVYLRAQRVAGAAGSSTAGRRAAGEFVAGLDRSMEWITTRGKYHHQEQRERMLDLFRQARERYAAVAGDTG
jgi:hypothetical protein